MRTPEQNPSTASPNITIRSAREPDIADIEGIYSYHVLHGTGSFEIDPPGAGEMQRRWCEVRARNLPFLVAECEGRVAGYAYARPYRPRAAYRFTVEDAVYVHPEYLGQGVGGNLLRRLIAECEAGGFRQMIAVIGNSANRTSIRLHESLGFVHAGVLHAVGLKFDRWLDAVIMQRSLGDGDSTQPPP
jgi:L-amino acid N-acyltransferase YncA